MDIGDETCPSYQFQDAGLYCEPDIEAENQECIEDFYCEYDTMWLFGIEEFGLCAQCIRINIFFVCTLGLNPF